MLHSISNIIHTLCKFPSLFIQSFKFHLSIYLLNRRLKKYNKAAIARGLEPLPLYIIH